MEGHWGGGSKWSLRVNPSSGNLHPTEAYAMIHNFSEAASASLYHYSPRAHALEHRAKLNHTTLRHMLQTAAITHGKAVTGNSSFFLALTSICWRETWKYGLRAFRYCQIDVGHAIAVMTILSFCVSLLTSQVELQAYRTLHFIHPLLTLQILFTGTPPYRQLASLRHCWAGSYMWCRWHTHVS